MISEICAYTKNYFVDPIRDIYEGNFEIKNGEIMLDFLKDGQYFRIVGSVFNDGVYKYPAENLTDEDFHGAVWAMNVPPAFVALAGEIKAYSESDAAKPTPYASESFGGYTYTRFTDSNGGNGSGWEQVFKDKLKIYRRLNVL